MRPIRTLVRPLSLHEHTQVAGAIAQHGHTLLGERCEHKLARLAVGQVLKGYGIDYLWIEVVFVDVASVLVLALIAYARSHHLAQSVDVVALQSETILYLIAHMLSPWLGTECANAKAYLVFAYPHAVHRFGQIERIRRCAGYASHSQVAYQLEVLLGIAGRRWHHRSSYMLHSVVGTQTTGEQSVAVAY